jgi:luciferase family oxidoreductase group 1
MLQHYSPYKVAENFNVLAALAPGRVDLGVGKAPGGLPLSTRALQQGLDQQEKGSFAEQLAQLDRWIRPENHSAEEAVRATPLPPVPAQGFLLGASTESALLAASLDWHFVFAAHLNGDPELLREVVSTWRKNSAREVIVAVQAIIAPTQVEAEALAQKVEVWGVELANGQRVTVASEDQAYAFARQAGSEPVRIARRAQSLLAGTAESVLEQLNALHAQWGSTNLSSTRRLRRGNARAVPAFAGRGASEQGGYRMSFGEQLIAWRRELHQNPELSGQEVETTARLRRWLSAAGITPLPYDLPTGVVAEIGTGNKLIALRADIDALPIEERSGVPFSSQQPGVMHACGHDIHTSVILGAALKLKAREASLKGRVRILFQPAEENFGGRRAWCGPVPCGMSARFLGCTTSPACRWGSSRPVAGRSMPTSTASRSALPVKARTPRARMKATTLFSWPASW